MKFKLTQHYSHAKRSKKGSIRSWLIYFVNGKEIFRQRVPFCTESEYGVGKWHYENEYIQNGKLFQTRYDRVYVAGSGFIKAHERKVSYPISKKKLVEIGVPIDLRIELTKNK